MLDGTEIIHLERAELLIDVVRWREAIHELHKYLTFFPDDYNALCQISRCHYELGEFKDAMKFANKAIESEPEREWAFRLQSLIYRETAENDKALESAEKCVQKSPHLDLSLQTLAYAQIRKFKLDEAEKTINSMLEVSPDSLETHDVCGYLALKKENWEKAEEHYLRALKINSQSANSLNNLGVVYLNQMDHLRKRARKQELRNKAAECFERAIKINPNYHLAHDNLKIAKSKSTISGGSILFWILLGVFLNGIIRVGGGGFAILLEYFTPYSTNAIIFGLNLYFILFTLIVLGFGIYIYFKGNTGKFTELFQNRTNLLVFAIAQIMPFFLFIIFLFLMENVLTPFSIISFIFFTLGTFYSIGKLIIYNETKHLQDE